MTGGAGGLVVEVDIELQKRVSSADAEPCQCMILRFAMLTSEEGETMMLARKASAAASHECALSTALWAS